MRRVFFRTTQASQGWWKPDGMTIDEAHLVDACLKVSPSDG